jgi:ribosomal protein S18 acetylase RimI-like enzyme
VRAVAFPKAVVSLSIAPQGWAAQGLGLRPATLADLSFLRQLYGQTREAELAGVPWPPEALERFLDDQFALQHHHYTHQFADALFLIVESQGAPIGRLYADISPEGCHVIDISIERAWQRRGLGTALLRRLQQASRTVTLNVNAHNSDARRLYEALGFAPMGEEGVYIGLRWAALS